MGIVISDMRRAFISPRFLIAIALVAFVRLFSGGEIKVMEDVVQTYLYQDELYELVFIICSIPFLNGFVEDWESRVFLSYVSRCGVVKYALSKYCTAILAALLCNLFGNALYVAILAGKGPLMLSEGSNHDTMSYCFLGGALAQRQPLLFLFGRWLSFSFVQTIVMAIALCFSTYCLKPLISLISPFIIYFLMSFLVWMLGAPGYLLPARQIKGNMTGSDMRDLCIYLSESCACVTLLGCAYLRRIKELMQRA